MELFDKAYFDNLFGEQSTQYFAHLPKPEQTGRKPELLSEHSALTMDYAHTLAKANGLNDIIESLVNESIPTNLHNKQLLAKTINKWFWRAIAFHDLGKINHLFQRDRMKNDATILHVKHNFESQHSIISAYLYLSIFFSEFLTLDLLDEEQIFLSNVVLYMSYPIKQHHSTSLNNCQNIDTWGEKDNGINICRKDIEILCAYMPCVQCLLNKEQINCFHDNFLGNSDFLFEHFNEDVFEQKCGFPLYSLVKLLYSLLTASDYLATAHYMNDWSQMPNDFGLITDDLRQKIIDNAHSTKSYNKKTFDDLDAGIVYSPDDYKERSGKNLNILRETLAMEVIKNSRQNHDKRLFYIEAPTGSGKTNTSMLALSELLAYNPSIQKVFYVFPFTTLITQTYKSMKDTLGLSDGEIVEFHSKSAKNTGKYEDDYLNYLDALFLNIPIVLLSHVSFFDALKTNSKDHNYLLQRMAHSVVVIDEVQSYSPAIWDKMVYFISNYAEYFDMRFVVMSATLPKIGDLIETEHLKNKFAYLVNDKNKYFQNPNFCNRVEFDYSLLETKRPDKDSLDEYLEDLCDFVSKQSQDYADNNPDNPNSVLTVIEFIFKKTASQFCSLAHSMNTCFDEILLLSGTILEPRRKQIINALKAQEYRTKKVLLITTQVVEAGVDIDMDLGFKDKSLIDSEEQLAGRINRNANKKICKLFLFDCNTEKTLYGSDDRFKFTKEISLSEYQNILNNKDFDFLYKKVLEHIMKRNRSVFTVNMQDLYGDVAHMDYPKVNNSFSIINQQNTTVFVPLQIDSDLLDESFSSIIKDLDIESSDTISGLDVWNAYKEIVLSEDEDFILNRIKLNKIRVLMSLFTFSVFPNSKEENTLKMYGLEEFGYLYLESYKEIYSFENGINTDKFYESNFL
ncbi:MAG: CRISPR-associated helicase Cas3' [Bacteroidales bacterium]|nr:CRISPR-associated helicase Cas3' [Bacteroidales bacterium]